MARRTVMYSSKGKKLYAVRDKGGDEAAIVNVVVYWCEHSEPSDVP